MNLVNWVNLSNIVNPLIWDRFGESGAIGHFGESGAIGHFGESGDYGESC